jgi:hypothetical protein
VKLYWKPHSIFPKSLSHAHHNGYSILWAKTSHGRFLLGGALYEVSPGYDEDEVSRLHKLSDVERHVK